MQMYMLFQATQEKKKKKLLTATYWDYMYVMKGSL